MESGERSAYIAITIHQITLSMKFIVYVAAFETANISEFASIVGNYLLEQPEVALGLVIYPITKGIRKEFNAWNKSRKDKKKAETEKQKRQTIILNEINNDLKNQVINLKGLINYYTSVSHTIKYDLRIKIKPYNIDTFHPEVHSNYTQEDFLSVFGDKATKELHSLYNEAERLATIERVSDLLENFKMFYNKGIFQLGIAGKGNFQGLKDQYRQLACSRIQEFRNLKERMEGFLNTYPISSIPLK